MRSRTALQVFATLTFLVSAFAVVNGGMNGGVVPLAPGGPGLVSAAILTFLMIRGSKRGTGR